MRIMSESFAFAGDLVVGEVLSRKLQEAGFALAESLSSARYIVTYCLSQSQLEDVYLGTDGAVESASPGCCLIDLSPSTHTAAREIYAVARVNELQALDAPLVLRDLCSHDAFGDSQNVMIPVGGEEDAFKEALPLLQALAGEVRFMGQAGMGQLAKMMATTQQAAALVSVVESRALARAHGELAMEAMQMVVDAGIALPGMQALYQAMAEGHFHGTHSCQVLMAEATAVMSAAEEAQMVLPQIESCERLLELFLVVGGGELAPAALILAYSEEEDGKPYGLEWARAEGLYHHHDHDHDHGDYDGFDDLDDEYGDEDDYAGYGGFPSH